MNTHDTETRLLADIGGTHARFGLQAGPDGDIALIETLACAEHRTVADAMHTYLARVGCEAPRRCAIAIANPVLGDRVAMTNHHWSFSISELKAQFGFSTLRVLNDFTALALALPSLLPTQLRQVGGGSPIPDQAIGLIGPGTGLGVSGLVPHAQATGSASWIPLRGEGGHVTLSAATAREHAVLAELGRHWRHVSAERAISGPGLVNLHRALTAIDRSGASEPALEPADITERALHGDNVCGEALDMFCALLGSVAGNLALTLGAQGGIYIGGGIVPRLGSWFEQSSFRQRFEDKGRFSSYLASIPVFVIHAHQSPALSGAAQALDVPS